MIMIDLNELKNNEHIKKGDYVRVKLRQSQIPSDGVIEEIKESYIVMKALESPDAKQIQQQLSKFMNDHTLSHVIIDRADIKYVAVMKKVEKEESTDD